MGCNLCSCSDYKKREGSVRDNKDLEIYECLNCGLVYLSSFDHINEAYYEESNMHKEIDFVKWQNETREDDERRYKFLEQNINNKDILDFGSGTGGFLKRVKPYASSICGIELERAVYPYYEENEIEVYDNLQNCKKQFDIITSFHVLEHLPNPKDILTQMIELLKKDGKIIIEVPNANDALLTLYKNKPFSNFTYWSCHLFLYTRYTLELLAKQVGLKVDFIKYVQRYPLSNHLYWLSEGKPGGHVKWGSFLDSDELTSAYENQLSSLGKTDTIIAQFSKENI